MTELVLKCLIQKTQVWILSLLSRPSPCARNFHSCNTSFQARKGPGTRDLPSATGPPPSQVKRSVNGSQASGFRSKPLFSPHVFQQFGTQGRQHQKLNNITILKNFPPKPYRAGMENMNHKSCNLKFHTVAPLQNPKCSA